MNTTKEKRRGVFNSVWDERQRQEYERINSSAYNLIWFLLLAATVGQILIAPREPKRWLVEFVLFLLVSGYVLVRYLRAGLWTRSRQVPSNRQNLLAALFASFAMVGLLIVQRFIVRTDRATPIAERGFVLSWWLVLTAVGVFLLTWGILSWLANQQQKRVKARDKELDEEEQG